MNREIILHIHTVHTDAANERQELSQTLSATFFVTKEGFCLVYEEIDEENHQSTKNTLKVSESGITLIRHGSIQSQMHFEVGTSHLCQYVTPFGVMHFEIQTERIVSSLTEDEGRISLRYSLLSDDSPVGSYILKMHFHN